MKVGDMVVRAYAYHMFIAGIIVDKVSERIEYEPEYDGEAFEPYNEWNFIVAWSDGTTSCEMDVELDNLASSLEWQTSDEQ